MRQRILLYRLSAVVSCALLQPSPAAQVPERGLPLLHVDFTAVTPDGRPVTDLKVEEVTVRIDGRERPLRSLQLITVADPTVSVLDTAPAEPLPAPFGANSESEVGRTLALVIDDDSFRPGREAPLRAAVARFLGALAPRDRISLVNMPYGGVKVPFTTEHSRIRTALLTLVGQAAANETGSDVACRSRRTLETLVGYLASLGIRDRPLTVMFVSAGLAAPRRDAPVSMAPGMCELQVELYRQVGTAAGAARAQFYIIQPEDIMVRGARMSENIAGSGFSGSDNPVEGLEHLSGVTGGKLLNLTGTDETALGRVLRESATHYLAAIDPQPSDRGRSHRLEVRVRRRGVELRTRPEITFADTDRITLRPERPSVREMIGVADVFRDLPLRAAAYSAASDDPGQVRVVAIVEPTDGVTQFSSLVAALFDRDGRLVTNWVAGPMDLARTPVIGAMPAEPGGYRLRVAAIDTAGRAGTVDYEVTAELGSAGTMKLSSIVLGLMREGGFSPRLEFTSEPVAIAQLELYGGNPGARIATALELSRTAHGDPLLAVPLAIRAAGEARYIASGAIAIGALPPGDYVVRALIGLDGQVVGRATRTLRKR